MVVIVMLIVVVVLSAVWTLLRLQFSVDFDENLYRCLSFEM